MQPARKNELPILGIISTESFRGERFSGEVSLDMIDSRVIIRTKEGGEVKIKSNELNDLMQFLDGARGLFE